jgi:alpha-beta hydrolase superfamily lysophospholipase
MRRFILLCMLLSLRPGLGQRPVHFPIPNGQGEIEGDLYGAGTKALILAHGGRFNKESWKSQADVFAHSGFMVLAIRFRGDSLNPDGSPSSEGSAADNADDVLAAAAYFHHMGARTVSAIGASLGGDAVGEADARSVPGTFDRIVLLGSAGGDAPAKLSGRKLFIVAREDRSASGLRLPTITEHFRSAPEPKRLVVLDGSAHAQFLFATSEGPLVMKTILQFLQAP